MAGPLSSNGLVFGASVLAPPESSVHSLEEILEWLRALRSRITVRVDEIPLSGLDQWLFDPDRNSLGHQSGRFFTISGIAFSESGVEQQAVFQPIIHQTDIGILGMLCKRFDGVLHVLIQGKCEPGNRPEIQLSPTVQATESNYKRVHGGAAPPYLGYFIGEKPVETLSDQRQSEQGTRFYRKLNRNVVVETTEEVEEGEFHRWITLGQLKRLLRMDNCVNVDSRTVLSTLPLDWESPGPGEFSLSAVSEGRFCNTSEVWDRLDRFRTRHAPWLRHLPLSALPGWEAGPDMIRSIGPGPFSIIGASVEISNREVKRWTQPLLRPVARGLNAFLVRKVEGVLHFLAQFKAEPGTRFGWEIGPTIQLDSYEDALPRSGVTFLDRFERATEQQILLRNLQSEEGGRFFREQNWNVIFRDEGFDPEDIPDRFVWMSYRQLNELMAIPATVNIQARGLMAAVSFATGERTA